MKNIIIAAGYATRLYPLTENFPKPLLKVGSKSILERMLDDIDNIADIDEHIIVTNHKFAHCFEEWKQEVSYKKPIRIVDDGTESNETRLGAVRDLLLAIDTFHVDDDMMVLAADNILDFSFQGFVDFFKEKGSSVIMCHYEPELKKLQRTGVIAVDDNWRVLQMQEKPQEPVSHWAVPPFYLYKKSDLPLIKDCMNHGCGFDAPGNLAHYLVDKTTVHAWQMPGSRFDIGSMDSYEEAQRKFV
jgi:glucose-1-phosphate thymidylyltransferase